MLSLLKEGFFRRGETWADLKCEGKELSISDKLIIDVIGVIRMSVQSFTKLVGIGSKSNDLHRAKRRRRRTDQTEESLCPSLGSGPTLAQGPSALTPLLCGTTFHYLFIQPPRLPPSEDVSKHTFSTWLPPPPVDTGVPNGLLMLRNSLNDFVFEHRSGCCATEPGYAGDIGAIKIWLIDWEHGYLNQKMET